MQILEDKENFLMNRKEVRVIVEADKNLSYEEALDIISQEFKAEKDNIVMKQVKGKFGRNTFLISAFIYKSKGDKEKFEPKKKEKKEEKKEEEKPVEKPTEPTEEKQQTEKKKEEAREEKPVEEEK